MAELSEIGGILFVTMIFTNFFFVGFAGYEVQPEFSTFVNDQNVTANSTLDGQFSINESTISTSQGSSLNFDFVVQSIGGTIIGVLGLVYAGLFAFADIANQLKVPNSIMIAVVYPLQIFMFVYGALVAGKLKNLIFGGGSGDL